MHAIVKIVLIATALGRTIRTQKRYVPAPGHPFKVKLYLFDNAVFVRSHQTAIRLWMVRRKQYYHANPLFLKRIKKGVQLILVIMIESYKFIQRIYRTLFDVRNRHAAY